MDLQDLRCLIPRTVRPAAAAASGDALVSLGVLGRRYAAAMRLVTLVPTALVASLLARDAPRSLVTWVLLAAVMSWSVGYAALLLYRPSWWVTLLDAVILAGLGLSSPWSVPPSWLAEARSWLLPFVAFACVGYQYSTRPRLGTPSALLAITGAIAGTTIALPEGASTDGLVTAWWSFIVAGLARGLWTRLERGGALADAVAANAERERLKAILSAARRAEERAHNRVLHDTAANTLLMVGLGQLAGGRDAVAVQARHDLERLGAWGDALPPSSDLMTELRRTAGRMPLTVAIDGPPQVSLPTAVTAAIADAAGEALTNVLRHAQVDACGIRIREDLGRVVVEVMDQGIGFDAENVPVLLRRGIRESIECRMHLVGGIARVDSQPEKGTRVELRWKP